MGSQDTPESANTEAPTLSISAGGTAPSTENQHGLRERIREMLRDPDGAPPRVGRFRIRRELGSGAMGAVYVGIDEDLDREVAVKLVRSDPRSDKARLRLKREAQALAQLAHPNVVPVFEVGDAQGQTFLAMELVVGQNLREWLKRQPRSWQEVVSVFMQAGEGLHAAHRAGIVHRDFKPENVLVGADGRVRVVDFGLATDEAPSVASTDPADVDSLPGSSSSLTRTGELIGTPAYMSPEQLAHGGVGPPSDQFSFCVALFEGLVGRRPFDGDTAASVVANVLQSDPRDLPADEFPAALRRALQRGLARDPAGRHPDMGALLDAVRPAVAPTTTPSRMSAVLLLVAGGLGAALVWMFLRDVDSAASPDTPDSRPASAEPSPRPEPPDGTMPSFEAVDPVAQAEAQTQFEHASALYAQGEFRAAADGFCRASDTYFGGGGTMSGFARIEHNRALSHLKAFASTGVHNHLAIAHELLYRLANRAYAFEGSAQLADEAKQNLDALVESHRVELARAGVDPALPSRFNLAYFREHTAGTRVTLDHGTHCIEPCTLAVLVDGFGHHLKFERQGYFSQISLFNPQGVGAGRIAAARLAPLPDPHTDPDSRLIPLPPVHIRPPLPIPE